MSVKVVGHVNEDKTEVYVLEGGQAVTFHTAKANDGTLRTFYTPLNVWPSVTASRLGIGYKFLRNASAEEAAAEAAVSGLVVKQVSLV